MEQLQVRSVNVQFEDRFKEQPYGRKMKHTGGERDAKGRSQVRARRRSACGSLGIPRPIEQARPKAGLQCNLLSDKAPLDSSPAKNSCKPLYSPTATIHQKLNLGQGSVSPTSCQSGQEPTSRLQAQGRPRGRSCRPRGRAVADGRTRDTIQRLPGPDANWPSRPQVNESVYRATSLSIPTRTGL